MALEIVPIRLLPQKKPHLCIIIRYGIEVITAHFRIITVHFVYIKYPHDMALQLTAQFNDTPYNEYVITTAMQ